MASVLDIFISVFERYSIFVLKYVLNELTHRKLHIMKKLSDIMFFDIMKRFVIINLDFS